MQAENPRSIRRALQDGCWLAASMMVAEHALTHAWAGGWKVYSNPQAVFFFGS